MAGVWPLDGPFLHIKIFHIYRFVQQHFFIFNKIFYLFSSRHTMDFNQTHSSLPLTYFQIAFMCDMFACVPACLGVCMLRCACGDRRASSGASPCLSLCLRQAVSFLVFDCVCEASWPFSFWGFSWPHLLPPHRNARIADACISQYKC